MKEILIVWLILAIIVFGGKKILEWAYHRSVERISRAVFRNSMIRDMRFY